MARVPAGGRPEAREWGKTGGVARARAASEAPRARPQADKLVSEELSTMAKKKKSKGGTAEDKGTEERKWVDRMVCVKRKRKRETGKWLK